ncbi:redoxin [Luteipulveratus mongoliensis]|uniref:Redoxin n=2 Tax=Luteipulveratus mongoliensis TaxID=571913 RepID=A0A0K1JR71_9MICO|nr:TlpA disulfide reductase family protein [Luteipulveratus mongoliensis]AKU19207.1 redoxin [Luteipulveratus mongoliensis]
MLAVVLVGGLAACSDDPNSISGQAKDGDNKGYVAGDGQIETLNASHRKKPVRLTGTTLAGKPWSLADAKGKVIVLNVWGSWCAPCQQELPHLQDAWASYESAKKPVQFVGVLQRDSTVSAQATLSKFKVTYPSLQDDGGKSLLGLQGKVVTTPTTLVIDQEGRIAARVSGQTTATTVRNLVDDVLGEKS